MKNDLTCGVVRDLLPSYVEGLTSEETNRAVEAHLSTCPDCTARKNAMTVPTEPSEDAEQGREVDYLKTVKRKSGRRVVIAIACTLAVILAGVALKLFVIGEPAGREGMSWSIRCDETAMDLRVYSTWSGVAYCRWDLENSDGVVRLTAKKVLPSFLYDSADHRERIPLEDVREVWIAEQLIWQDGLMLEQFPHIVDVDFSAEMEKNLDKVESGKTDWHKTVDDFYKGFAASLEQAEKNMEGKKVKVPDEPSSEVCDLCGRPMVIKVGKYGKFLACSGFPECRGTKRLVKDTGGICPKCGKGRMLERKSAKGRIYYGCERYPDCDFMTWDMPVAVKCEKCGSTLFRKGSKLYCAKEGCDFEMPVPKKD